MNEPLNFHHLFEPAKNGSSRTILALHGTGGDENSLIPLANAIDPNAAVLAVRGKISENGANRFFRRLAEGVFDMEDLFKQTQDLADFAMQASKTYGFSLDQLFAMGYSNGANVAVSMLLLRPSVLAGGLLFRAMVPFEPTQPSDLSGKRILLSEGRHDPLVPEDNAMRLADILTGFGAETKLNWNDLGHQLGRAEIVEAATWLNT